MPRICDRSPCDPLLRALGVWIFGSPERPGFVIVAAKNPGEEEVPSEMVEEEVEYCPFCGTRLDEVSQVAIERFMRPRKRRRPKMPAA